jgi:hypothetical protein
MSKPGEISVKSPLVVCRQCGNSFRRRHGQVNRKFCSRFCFTASGIPSENGKTNRGRPSPRKIANKDVRAYNRTSYRKLREKVIKGLGGECACCRESIYGLLTLEHVGGWGREHRMKSPSDRLRKRATAVLLRDVIRSGYDKTKFEVRCYNCNLGASNNGGMCPHVTEFLRWEECLADRG